MSGVQILPPQPINITLYQWFSRLIFEVVFCVLNYCRVHCHVYIIRGPSSKDRGPRAGVTGAVSVSDLDICWGVGAVAAWSAVRGPRSFDGLAEAVSHFIDFQGSRTCL